MLITLGMALAVLGLQQSSVWGWDDAKTWGCIALGIAILAAFVRYELRTENPLLQLTIFKDKAFAVDNIVLFLLMIPFVPLFFFAGFATASQWAGKCSTGSGRGARWSSAAASPRSASTSGGTR